MSGEQVYKLLSKGKKSISDSELEFCMQYLAESIELFQRNAWYFINCWMPKFMEYKLFSVEKIMTLTANIDEVSAFFRCWFRYFLEGRDEVEILLYGNLHRSYHMEEYQPFICPHFNSIPVSNIDSHDCYVTASITGLSDLMYKMERMVS